MRSRTALAALLAAPVLLAACSSGDGSDDAASPSVSTAGMKTSATTGNTSASDPAAGGSAAPAGCPAPAPGQPSGVPQGATSKPTLDVDGDGRADTVYIDDETDAGGGVVFGIQTASGGDFFESFNSASGQDGRTVLVADVTGRGQFVAFADDGRQIRLFAISACSFVPEMNAQGQQYTFDRGFSGYGTGVGCADADGDGTPDLLGLKADGTTVSRTIVTLDGPDARNGATSTISNATQAQLDQARTITCGDLTEQANGVGIGG